MRRCDIFTGQLILMTALTSLGLIGCFYLNKDHMVELYYKETEPIKYYIFLLSYSIVTLGFFLNFQYLCKDIFIRYKDRNKCVLLN